MRIKPVGADARNTKEFIELPVRLYKGVSNWIRPLDTDIEDVFHLKPTKCSAPANVNGGFWKTTKAK